MKPKIARVKWYDTRWMKEGWDDMIASEPEILVAYGEIIGESDSAIVLRGAQSLNPPPDSDFEYLPRNHVFTIPRGAVVSIEYLKVKGVVA